MEALNDPERLSYQNDIAVAGARLTELYESLHEPDVDEAATWTQIIALFEERRRLIDSEMGRLRLDQQVLTIEEAMGLAAALLHAVRRHVVDKDVLAEIGREVNDLVNRSTRS